MAYQKHALQLSLVTSIAPTTGPAAWAEMHCAVHSISMPMEDTAIAYDCVDEALVLSALVERYDV